MRRILLCLIALILVVGCQNKSNQNSNKKSLKIVTSIYPMTDFTKKIVGDKAEVIQMVPVNSEAHSWEPAAQDIVNLENANLFIYNGAGMEHWVGKVLSSIDNKNIKVVDASKDLELIEGHKHNHEEHNHEEHNHEEHNHEEHNHEEHSHVANDPHTWISLRNAKHQMGKIVDALKKADLDNSEFYQQNYEKYKLEFDKLDQEFTEATQSFQSKDFVVTHEAFGYLAKDYGLNQIGIEGVVPTSEPDPSRVAEIIELVKEHNITTIFFEELVNPEVAKTIAKEAKVKVDLLNPLGSLSEKEIQEGQDYFSVMRKNLESLKKALK